MKITLHPLPLVKRYPLTISRGTAAGSENLLVIVDHDGVVGIGEFAPVSEAKPAETAATAGSELSAIAARLAPLAPWEFQRIDAVTVDSVRAAARCALDIALHDWCGTRFGVPAYQLLGGDVAAIVPTSLTIGINPIDVLRERVPEIVARLSPKALKIKLGSPAGTEHDRAIYAAVKELAPVGISLRVDANGGWGDVVTAIRMIEWLAEQGAEYVEQPLAEGRESEFPAVFERRKLPIYADESCRVAEDIPALADRVDGVNLKLTKAGGMRAGIRLIHVARAHGLKVMMGCMSESSLSIAASVAISSYADHLDLDSHLNLIDPPFVGLIWEDGRVLPSAKPGMGISPREGILPCPA